MEYGAIDLHTKESEIRIVEADGAVVFERRIATTRDRLVGLTSFSVLRHLRGSSSLSWF